jgi:amidase
MFAEAQARAQYLDDLRAQGRSAGPLHGLPVSIKDNFHYKGTEATIGMVSFLDEVSTENSPLVDILLKLGAVIYVKTNIPQTMMVCMPFSTSTPALTEVIHRPPILTTTSLDAR